MLAFLRAVTWNVWPALAEAGVLAPDFSLGAAKLNYLAQRLEQLAIVPNLMGCIDVPVACSAVVVATVVMVWVCGAVGYLEPVVAVVVATVVMVWVCGSVGYLEPVVAVVVATVVLVWVCGSVGYLEPAVIGCMLLIGLIVALAAFGIDQWWLRSRTKESRCQDRAQSAASSDTSRGMLMQPLLAEDELTGY